jgi:hypothetical protein
MPRWRTLLELLILTLMVSASTISPSYGQQGDTSGVPVNMTITASPLGEENLPDIKRDEVKVNLRGNQVPIINWVAARGEHAGLDLFILIDDASDRSLGSQFGDLKSFITSQPASTSVGIGYMRNTTIDLRQDFTSDHAQAANAIRLPMGNVGAFGSPYLSVIDLMKRWPEHPNRREIILITDGIDRARGGPRPRMSNIIPDVDRASEMAQRTGTLVYTIYFPGVGHMRRNFWEANNGQLGIAKLSDETGAESFFLGFQAPVSLKPYLDEINRHLQSQYLLTFGAQPTRNQGLQPVSVETDVSGIELVAADNAWVPEVR